MKKRLTTLLAVAMAYALVPTAHAAVITIGASKDASIFQNNVNNSSGAGNGLIAGTNAQSSPRRASIAFDVAGSIPANATIQNVQLNLTLGAVAGGGGPGGGPATATIGLHELLANWGEGIAQQQNPPNDTLGGQGQGAAASNGDVTWNSNFHSTSLWGTPGGDFAGSASASAVVGTTLNGVNSWLSTPGLVSDVQGWLDSPASNFGWLMVNADEATANTGRTFYSRNVATAAFHPQLEITYEVIPEPSAAALAVAGVAACLIASGARRTGGDYRRQ